jgi:hypothetical protein
MALQKSTETSKLISTYHTGKGESMHVKVAKELLSQHLEVGGYSSAPS